MIRLKGEPAEPYLMYNSRKEIIYEYYVKLINDCKDQIREANQQIKKQRQLGTDEKSPEIKVLKNTRTRMRNRLNKYYDFVWKQVSLLDSEESAVVEKDLIDRHIIEDYYKRYI